MYDNAYERILKTIRKNNSEYDKLWSPQDKTPYVITDVEITQIIEELQKNDFIRTLGFPGHDISDDGLKDIWKLTNIEMVDFSGNNRLTSGCLVHFKKIKHLFSLDLEGVKCTEEEITSFLEDMPNLVFFYVGQNREDEVQQRYRMDRIEKFDANYDQSWKFKKELKKQKKNNF